MTYQLESSSQVLHIRFASCALRAEPREKLALQKEQRSFPISRDRSLLCRMMLLLLLNLRPPQQDPQHRRLWSASLSLDEDEEGEGASTVVELPISSADGGVDDDVFARVTAFMSNSIFRLRRLTVRTSGLSREEVANSVSFLSMSACAQDT